MKLVWLEGTLRETHTHTIADVDTGAVSALTRKEQEVSRKQAPDNSQLNQVVRSSSAVPMRSGALS